MTPGIGHQQEKRKNTLLGAIAGAIVTIFTKKSKKTTPEDLRKHDFPTSTQRTGIRFSEHIRDVFRHRWLKRH